MLDAADRLHLSRQLASLAGELGRRGFPYANVVDRAAKVLAADSRAASEHTAGDCPQCLGPVERKPSGRPAVYCGARCRKAAWRERNRDVMGG